MAKSPDHMAGINALPSTQAYNAALAAMKAGDRSPGMAAHVEALRMQAMRDRNDLFPLENNPFGRHGTLAKSVNKQLQKEVNQAIADRAPKHATLRATIPSTCLASLTFNDGIATAEFYRGGAVIYDYPMSKAEFVDWVSGESLGKYGNENVF
jgi:hypothetical protein